MQLQSRRRLTHLALAATLAYCITVVMMVVDHATHKKLASCIAHLVAVTVAAVDLSQLASRRVDIMWDDRGVGTGLVVALFVNIGAGGTAVAHFIDHGFALSLLDVSMVTSVLAMLIFAVIMLVTLMWSAIRIMSEWGELCASHVHDVWASEV
jgi:hypothetical protein